MMVGLLRDYAGCSIPALTSAGLKVCPESGPELEPRKSHGPELNDWCLDREAGRW